MKLKQQVLLINKEKKPLLRLRSKPCKVYTVATDDFFASGGDNLIPNKIQTGEYDQRYDYDKDKLTCDYIKKLVAQNKEINIVDDGRITVVDA